MICQMHPATYVDFIDHVTPVLQKRGLAQTEYAPGSLRQKMFPESGGRFRVRARLEPAPRQRAHRHATRHAQLQAAVVVQELASADVNVLATLLGTWLGPRPLPSHETEEHKRAFFPTSSQPAPPRRPRPVSRAEVQGAQDMLNMGNLEANTDEAMPTHQSRTCGGPA